MSVSVGCRRQFVFVVVRGEGEELSDSGGDCCEQLAGEIDDVFHIGGVVQDRDASFRVVMAAAAAAVVVFSLSWMETASRIMSRDAEDRTTDGVWLPS